MSSLSRFLLSVMLIFACSPMRALALGGEHPATQPINNVHGDWPSALVTVINSAGRVGGDWVNANDEFFYIGGNNAFGKFVRKLAETKLPLTLVLHTTAQRRSLLWGESRVRYDWTLLVGAAGWTSPEWKLNFGTKYAVRVDLWVDGGLTDDTIDLPTNVRLSVDREVVATTRPTAPQVAR